MNDRLESSIAGLKIRFERFDDFTMGQVSKIVEKLQSKSALFRRVVMHGCKRDPSFVHFTEGMKWSDTHPIVTLVFLELAQENKVILKVQVTVQKNRGGIFTFPIGEIDVTF